MAKRGHMLHLQAASLDASSFEGLMYTSLFPPDLSHMVQAWYVHVSQCGGICSVHSSSMVSNTLAINMHVMMHTATKPIPVSTNTNVSMQKPSTQDSPSHTACPSCMSLQPSAPWL